MYPKPPTGEGSGGRPGSMYPNCSPLGLIAILQGGDKTCPDDSSLGGFITFEFREPVEFIKLISLLDTKSGNTPEIKITYDGGNKTMIMKTPPTGDNGFVSIPFDTNIYRKVTMLDIKILSAGTINSF